MSPAPVLVVGAGPVGLTAACQLARLGVAVRVVEELAEPTTESRAVGVHARSLEMLASLGVLPRLEARGRRIGALAMVDGASGRTRARMDLTGIAVATRHPYVLDVAQPDTEAVLAERAAELGIVVERGVALTGLHQDADGVDVTLRTGEGDQTARVAWVVGADGGHSTVRHLVGTRLEGGFHGQHFAMADLDADSPFPRDTISMFTHPDGMGIFFPLPGSRARIMFLVDAPGPDAGDPTLEQIQALADVRMGGQITVRNPRWMTYFEVHHAQVAQYRHGRVVLAGDAAHVHSPAAAQGMNTGIQDAANLAWKLALVVGGRADEGLIDSYDGERHPVGAAVVRNTTVLTDVGTGSGVQAAVRDAMLFLAGHLAALRDQGARQLSEVAVNYRDSALSVDRGGHHHGTVRAGEHAPDPAGVTPAIEDLLARPGFLVLASTATAGPLEEVLGDLGAVIRVVGEGAGEGRVVDPEGAIARTYGIGTDGFALVRPDGYLALVSDSADPAILRDYLVDVLGITEPARV